MDASFWLDASELCSHPICIRRESHGSISFLLLNEMLSLQLNKLKSIKWNRDVNSSRLRKKEGSR